MKTVKITIDGKVYDADPSKNLLEACLGNGLNLPYFCWHPAMGSVGACRQCAVKRYRDENDKAGRLIMSCMEPVTEGMIISIEDKEAKEFREGIIEWLMTNHPHDCPVCDEGGECHLQDMTLMTGHNYRRYEFTKRTYRNQYLGPFLNHEMNRCIQCYRCVRFYKDYAGGKDFDVFGAHNHVYFGRHEDGVLENEFAGNLAEVCPTGVFTDKTLKNHYTRKWDLTNAPSICVHCGVGCNTIAAERYRVLRRIQTRYNGEVNGYFLCDRGRFGYEFVNSDKRIRNTMILNKENGKYDITSADETLKYLKKILSGSKRLTGIGSPRASLESNFALMSLVTKDNFYWGVTGKDYSLIEKEYNVLKGSAARTPSLRDIEKCDVVVVLGEDLTNTAPMIALAVRQSVRQIPVQSATPYRIPHWQDQAVRELVQDEKGPVFVASPYTTKLDDIAETYRGMPADIARLGYMIAAGFSDRSPKVDNPSDELTKLSQQITDALKKAERPLIISGYGLGSHAVVEAASNLANAMIAGGKNVELCLTTPECNSMGMAMMGGETLDRAYQAITNKNADTVIILENDLYRRDEAEKIDRFLSGFKNVIVIDHMGNPTVLKADVVIPSGTFAESDGTLVNNEGRAQRFYQVYVPDTDIKEGWRWIREIMLASGLSEFGKWERLSDFTSALVKAMPQFDGITGITPPPGFRIAGEKIPRESHRYSGRTAMHADRSVHEPKPPEDVDSPLSFTMEGYRGKPPSSIIPFFWSPGWNSQQAINKYQIEIGGALHGGDPGKRMIEPFDVRRSKIDVRSAGDQSKVQSAKYKVEYFMEVPSAFRRSDEVWSVVPVWHIFGSEEQSQNAAAIATLAPQPYVMMSPAAAGRLGLTKGSELEIEAGGKMHRYPVKLDMGIPDGALGLPVGIAGVPFIDMSMKIKIKGI